MSQLAHPHPLIAARRHPRVSWLVVALIVCAAAVSIMLFSLADDDDVSRALPVVSTLTVDGIRYDGGPEEGTAAVSSVTVAPPARYDGGPNEGSAPVSSVEGRIIGRGGPMGVLRDTR